MVKLNINMKNGDKHKIKLLNLSGKEDIREVMSQVIYNDYKKTNDLNLGAFLLDNESDTSIIINLEDISSIEYGLKVK